MATFEDITLWIEILKVTLWGLLFCWGMFSGTFIICLAIDLYRGLKRDRARRKKEIEARKHRSYAPFMIGIAKSQPNDDKTVEFFYTAGETIKHDYR